MTDIQYWEDTLVEDIAATKKLLAQVPDAKDKIAKVKLLEKAKARLKSASITKRTYKIEFRLLQNSFKRRQCESRLDQLDQELKMLQQEFKAYDFEMERDELIVPTGSDICGENGVIAGDNMLQEASCIQDKTQDSLARTKALIAKSKNVGLATAEELGRQNKVLQDTESELDRVDDNLTRAASLLKQFGKKVATDSFIHCFALVNCLLLLGIILFVVIKKGGLATDDDGTPVDPTVRWRKALN